MLSFNRGKDIAVFQNGKMKGKKIRLYGEHNFKQNQKPDITIDRSEYPQLLTKEFYKEQSITPAKRRTFNDLLIGKGNMDNISEETEDQLEEAKSFIDNELRTKVYFDDVSTKLFPLPQKDSERIYVPAPSGSGKSTFIGMYLDEIRKMKNGKGRTIYIFSRVEKDEPLDRHKKVVRIPLEDDYFEKKPLLIEDFKNGILIFDDIDTILNKKLVKYLRNFRDDVLETGRHYGITTISTSHLIANFLATRTLINEANAIVLFPRGSSFSAISNFLDRYMGFNKSQIKYISQLPTRWIYIWKEYPKYIIHEKGVILF